MALELIPGITEEKMFLEDQTDCGNLAEEAMNEMVDTTPADKPASETEGTGETDPEKPAGETEEIGEVDPEQP